MPSKEKTFNATTRAAWRRWLRENHKREKFVWLVKHKVHTGRPTLSHHESMEEAICFGWIDTIVKRLDENRYMRGFARRNEGSSWSKATQGYARELIAKGKMAKAGMKAYEDGLKKPVIDHDLPRNPATPADLGRLLEKHGKAKAFFGSLAPSYRRYFIWWIERAKLPETRKRRLKQVMEALKAGRKR